MSNMYYKLFIQENPAFREAFAMLTGNIYVETEQKNIKTYAITSTEPKAGKTAAAENLGITLASWEKKTLLVDADMRKISSKNHHKAEPEPGLFEYLNGKCELESIICSTNVDNLSYIPAGAVSYNPMGVLCSDKLSRFIAEAGDCFDYIIFDTPSLGSVSDAAIIASKVDATLLVAKMGKTKFEDIQHAKSQLEKNNSNLLGVILNKVNKRRYRSYFKDYRYYVKQKKVPESENVNIDITSFSARSSI